MNDTLKQVFSTWWRTLGCAWAYRTEVLKVIEENDRLKAEVQPLKDELHLKNLEIALLKEKMGKEEQGHNKTRNYMRKLVTFIALRHRIDTPAENGTIRQQLQQMEGRR